MSWALKKNVGKKREQGPRGGKTGSGQGQGKDWGAPRGNWAARTCSHSSCGTGHRHPGGPGKEVQGGDVANKRGSEEMGPYWQVPAGQGRDGAARSSSAAQRGRWKAGESPTVSPPSSLTGRAILLQEAAEAGLLLLLLSHVRLCATP